MGLINKNSAQNRSERSETTSQAPTDMRCPANGCCLPADTPNGGEFACVFHADRPTKYWPLITEVTNEWLPAWIMAHQLDRYFGDEEIADMMTQRLNALPVVKSRKMRFVSELEAERRMRSTGQKERYDLPVQKLYGKIIAEIEDKIKVVDGTVAASRDRSAAEAMERRREKISTMCNRIAKRNWPGMRPTTNAYDDMI